MNKYNVKMVVSKYDEKNKLVGEILYERNVGMDKIEQWDEVSENFMDSFLHTEFDVLIKNFIADEKSK